MLGWRDLSAHRCSVRWWLDDGTDLGSFAQCRPWSSLDLVPDVRTMRGDRYIEGDPVDDDSSLLKPQRVRRTIRRAGRLLWHGRDPRPLVNQPGRHFLWGLTWATLSLICLLAASMLLLLVVRESVQGYEDSFQLVLEWSLYVIFPVASLCHAVLLLLAIVFGARRSLPAPLPAPSTKGEL